MCSFQGKRLKPGSKPGPYAMLLTKLYKLMLKNLCASDFDNTNVPNQAQNIVHTRYRKKNEYSQAQNLVRMLFLSKNEKARLQNLLE